MSGDLEITGVGGGVVSEEKRRIGKKKNREGGEWKH